MNLESLLSPALNATSSFNPQIAIALLIICSIGEFGPSIPYLLETIWLLCGYHIARGVLPPFDLLLIWLVAQAGRQIGATALYNVSKFGSLPLIRLYKKRLEGRLSGRRNIVPARIARLIANISPFSIALGRLMGLRIPITLTLGVKRKPQLLSLGVLLSSVVWDGIYLILGVTVGATAVIKPINMALYSLAGLTVLYLSTLLIRYLLRLRRNRVKLA